MPLKLVGDLYIRVLSMTSALSPQSLVVADGTDNPGGGRMLPPDWLCGRVADRPPFMKRICTFLTALLLPVVLAYWSRWFFENEIVFWAVLAVAVPCLAAAARARAANSGLMAFFPSMPVSE